MRILSFKNISVVLSIVLFITFFVACHKSEPYRIGISQCSDDDWRTKMDEEIMREAMFHDNISVEIRSADDNSQKQVADLQYFIDNNFDIIVAAPNEAEALTPIIKDIYESGKPVIVFDRNINGDYYTAFQGADNIEIGVLAAKLAGSMMPSGSNVIEICGLEGSTPAIERRLGFDNHAPSLGINILGHGNGDWNATDGVRVADSLLRLYPQTDIIYAHNDRMAIAAANVAKRLGLSHIKVIGIDAAPTIGIEAVADSIIDATFLYPTEGHQLIRTAINILEGKPFDHYHILPTATVVDKNNAEILLLQDKALKEETNKISLLKSRMDMYWEKHSIQTALLYGVIVILILLAGLIFMLLRAYWSHVKHRKMVEAQNAELAKQKDELDNLYRQLQEATASKLTFFTNVSHDLRTPLTLIADPIEQLSQAENLTSQQHTLALLANKNAKILTRLINQILDFRKYENGKMQLNLVPSDLATDCIEWTQAFKMTAIKNHINFNVIIEPGKSYQTAFDKEKVERVLFNLLSNAFKFTPANGTIIVKLDADDSNIILSVSDSGQGMTAEEANHIFERFYTIDKINPHGSGIGLAVAKAFVELHNGSISVESMKDMGSTFFVKLPIVNINQVSSINVISEDSAPVSNTAITELTDVEQSDIEIDENAKTILVIDDNNDIYTLIQSLLADKFTVLHAANGMMGIKMALKYIPDLILCDVMMPGIDGMETCRRLKNETASSHIPVLMITACALDEQRIQGYDCGADGYLTKPFNSKVLIAQCDSLIKNRIRVIESTGLAPNSGQNATTKSTTPTTKASDSNIDNEFYDKFVSIIERELANSEISVEDIASELGMSRVQLYRKIKAITNFAPAEILRNMRLQRADRLLKSTECNVSEIAYSVGFTSPSYFTKCYKEYFGESPTEVQKRTSKITH